MKMRWMVGVVVLAIAAALVAWWSLRTEAAVEVVSPAVRALRAYVEEQAVTELSHDYLISMPIAGWLEPIQLREGDVVSKDQVVARLETDDLRDRVDQAAQRIAVLETQIAETTDHRLENNALVQAEATVKAIDETVRAAEAKLEASRALLDFTESELSRVKGLMEAGSGAEREVREAELEYRQALAEYQSDKLELAALRTIAAVSYVGPKFINDYIDRKSFTLEQRKRELAEAKTQLEIERRNLGRAEIRAPVEGIVLERHQTRRQYLAAGTPLLTIGRLEDMEVIADVLTERAARISPGDDVEVFGQGLAEGPIRGTVHRVYPAGFKKISSLGVEQQRVNVAVRFNQRPESLGVGFRVYVRIFYDEVPDALTLPRTALFRDEAGRWQVMVVRGGVTELRSVGVGLMSDEEVQITEGLGTDDLVVTRPSREIAPNTRVEAVFEG